MKLASKLAEQYNKLARQQFKKLPNIFIGRMTVFYGQGSGASIHLDNNKISMAGCLSKRFEIKTETNRNRVSLTITDCVTFLSYILLFNFLPLISFVLHVPTCRKACFSFKKWSTFMSPSGLPVTYWTTGWLECVHRPNSCPRSDLATICCLICFSSPLWIVTVRLIFALLLQ